MRQDKGHTRLWGARDALRFSVVLNKCNRSLEGWITVDWTPLIESFNLQRLAMLGLSRHMFL